MATNKDRVQALKARRKEIEAALAKGEQVIDALKGRQDEQARARRATVHATAEKLRDQKEKLSERIKQMEDADEGSDVKGLREKLKAVVEQQKSRASVLNDQIASIRERIDAAVGDNKLLQNLVSKERLSMQIKFNSKVLKLIDNSEQRGELSKKAREEADRFEKIDKDLAEALKTASETHGDDQDARDAERRARELSKSIASKEAELDDLSERLGDADDEEERADIQKKIDAVVGEIDDLYAKREEGRKKDREREKPKDGKDPKDGKGAEAKRDDDELSVPALPDDADEESRKLHKELGELKSELSKLDQSKNADQYGVLKVALKNKRATLLKRLKK